MDFGSQRLGSKFSNVVDFGRACVCFDARLVLPPKWAGLVMPAVWWTRNHQSISIIPKSFL